MLRPYVIVGSLLAGLSLFVFSGIRLHNVWEKTKSNLIEQGRAQERAKARDVYDKNKEAEVKGLKSALETHKSLIETATDENQKLKSEIGQLRTKLSTIVTPELNTPLPEGMQEALDQQLSWTVGTKVSRKRTKDKR